MAKSYRDDESGPGNFCPACSNTKDQAARHRHFLAFEGDLPDHLKQSGVAGELIIGITAWAQTMRAQHGGYVTEDGRPLSAYEARSDMHRQYRKVYYEQPGKSGNEPRTEKGRKIARDALHSLLTKSRSEYANAWGEMLGEQFPEAKTEEQWTDFARFAAEFQDNTDSAVPGEPIDTRPLLYAVKKGEL